MDHPLNLIHSNKCEQTSKRDTLLKRTFHIYINTTWIKTFKLDSNAIRFPKALGKQEEREEGFVYRFNAASQQLEKSWRKFNSLILRPSIFWSPLSSSLINVEIVSTLDNKSTSFIFCPSSRRQSHLPPLNSDITQAFYSFLAFATTKFNSGSTDAELLDD